jgi:hypothetical protein
MEAGGSALSFRFATLADCHALAELNHQLIRDEGHRNPMTVPEVDQRMRSWLAGEYRAVLFEAEGGADGPGAVPIGISQKRLRCPAGLPH